MLYVEFLIGTIR